MTEVNVYCDESCHLEHDHQKVMVLGAVTCPVDKTREIAARIRELKVQHGLPPKFEIKWTKVSKAKQDFYLSVLDYFFDDDDDLCWTRKKLKPPSHRSAASLLLPHVAGELPTS